MDAVTGVVRHHTLDFSLISRLYALAFQFSTNRATALAKKLQAHPTCLPTSRHESKTKRFTFVPVLRMYMAHE